MNNETKKPFVSSTSSKYGIFIFLDLNDYFFKICIEKYGFSQTTSSTMNNKTTKPFVSSASFRSGIYIFLYHKCLFF